MKEEIREKMLMFVLNNMKGLAEADLVDFVEELGGIDAAEKVCAGSGGGLLERAVIYGQLKLANICIAENFAIPEDIWDLCFVDASPKKMAFAISLLEIGIVLPEPKLWHQFVSRTGSYRKLPVFLPVAKKLRELGVEPLAEEDFRGLSCHPEAIQALRNA